MALRQRSTGVAGSPAPKEAYIWSCSAANRLSASASELWLRATVMSTMEPEAMLGGSRMDGNSICGRGHDHQHRKPWTRTRTEGTRVARGSPATVCDAAEASCACCMGRGDGMPVGRHTWRVHNGGGREQTYKPFVGREQHGDASVDLADGEGDQHGDRGSSGRWAGSCEGVAGVEKGQLLVAI